METTHSKNSRTKKPAPQIVVPSWDKVWESFEEHNDITTIEAMNAEGWKTVDQVVKSVGLSRTRIYNMIREGKFERVKKKVHIDKSASWINFVRPKV